MNKRQKAIAQAVPSRVMTATEFEYATDNYKEFRKSRKMTNTQFKEYRDTISEGKFSKSLIAKAIKIAKKSSGNMTAAFNAIEKIKKGLGDDPEVANALKLANESKKEDDEENALLDKEALGEALKPKDKKAVDAFYDGKGLTLEPGQTLHTDGITLKSTGIGAQTIATKVGGKFKIVAKMDGRFTQSVVKYIKKSFPKNLIKEEVELDEAMRVDRTVAKGNGQSVPSSYSKMLKNYKDSENKKVYDILDKAGWRLGEQGQTLVTNMLKKHKGDVKKTAKDIMKKYPKMKKEEVELDEALKPMSKKGDYEFGKDTSKNISYVKYKGKVISTGDFDSGADAWFMNIKGEKGQRSFDKPSEVIAYFTKKKITEEVELDEVKMNDPKLNKLFDKLKKGSKVKFKISSTIAKGKEFTEYMVTAKNTVNKGRVEKITLVTKENPKSVKKYLYRRDGKVTFAIGDMGASIDDFQESYHTSFSQYLSEGVYDPKDGEKWAKEIQKGINAPVVQVTTSSLGGVERMSIMVKFSMDKEAAKGGVAWHNSRHANLRVDIDGSLEMFMASHKFGIKRMRKAKIKSAKDVIKKINDWIKKVPDLKEEVQEEVLAEAYKYKIDHKTYTSAVEEALVVAEKAKYEVDMDDYFNSIATGPRKPGEGKTNTFKIALTKNGKEQRKKLQIQIYGKGKHGYELNCYIA